MLIIPKDYSNIIKQIIEWHLRVYMPDIGFNIHLNSILEHFYKKNMVDGLVVIDGRDLYYLNECISNAINNISECGIDKDVLWEIYDWVITERQKEKGK